MLLFYLFGQCHWHSLSQFVKATIDSVPASLLNDFMGNGSSLWRERNIITILLKMIYSKI